MIRFVELNPFQKLVLSLVAGLAVSNKELEYMQQEFLRLDQDKTGSLKIEDIKKIADSEGGKMYSKFNHDDWDQILKGVDLNGDGVIDFQDFISACVDRRALVKSDEVRKAFQIIDTNKDGLLCHEDFKNLFNSYDHGGQQMSEEMWTNLLGEADKNGDGKIDYQEFESAMKDVFRKSWLRQCD